MVTTPAVPDPRARNSQLTEEALKSRDEEYEQSLSFRAARETDLQSVTSSFSAISTTSVGSSRRGRPRRLQLTCDVRLLQCEISAAAVPGLRSPSGVTSPPTAPLPPTRRFRVGTWHRSRRVGDAKALARLEMTARGPIYRCAWTSADACSTLATAVNRHQKLRPPLLLIFELCDEARGGFGPPTERGTPLAHNSVVLEEYHAGRRRGRVTLSGGAVLMIEVTFVVLPASRPPSELSVDYPPFPGARSTPAPDLNACDTGPPAQQPAIRQQPKQQRIDPQPREDPRQFCACVLTGTDTEAPAPRRRRGRVAFQDPRTDDQPQAGRGAAAPPGLICERSADRTPVNPCTKGAPTCEPQCTIL